MTFWERNQLKLAPFLFLAPAVGLFLIFVIYPIADSIWVSFHEWSGVNRYAVDDAVSYTHLTLPTILPV